MPASTPSTQRASPKQERQPIGVAFACVSQAELADVLGVVARQVRNLEKEGLPREAEGYPVARCVRWYVEFKQAEAVQRTQAKTAPSTRSDAEDRKAIAEAGILEVRLRREVEELVEVTSYEAELRRILFAMRREINNLVGFLAPNILHLNELAEARRMARRARDELLRRLQEIARADPEDGESEQ